MILEWNILHRVDSLINSNHLRSHPRAIMALDQGRLGLESKSGPIFCFRQVYFYKILPTNLSVNQRFIPFIHLIWGETVLWGAVFIIETSDRMKDFTIFHDKLHSVNIQDDQWWAFSETVQILSKITCTACRLGRFPFDKRQISSASYDRVFEWKLVELRFKIIKNLLCLFFI